MADDDEGSGTTLIIFIILLLCGCGAFYFFYYRYTTGWTTISDVSVDPSLKKPDATEISLYKAQKTAYDNNNLAFFIVSNGASTYDVYYYPPGKNAPKPVSGKATLYYKNAPTSSSSSDASSSATSGGSSSATSGGSSSATSGGSSSATSGQSPPKLYAQFVGVNVTPGQYDISGGGENMTTRQCKDACDKNSQCNAFVMGGAQGKTCYLKSAYGPVEVYNDITTSYITAKNDMKYAYIQEKNMYKDSHNLDGGTPTNMEPNVHANACDNKKDCQGFVMNINGNAQIKTDTGSYIQDTNAKAFVKASDNLLNLNAPFFMKHASTNKYVAYDSTNKLSSCTGNLTGSFKLVIDIKDATPITASLSTGLYHWNSSGVVTLKTDTGIFIKHCGKKLVGSTSIPANSDVNYTWKFIPVKGKSDTYITYNYYNSNGIEVDTNNYLELGGGYTTNNQPTGEIPMSTTEWILIYKTEGPPVGPTGGSTGGSTGGPTGGPTGVPSDTLRIIDGLILTDPTSIPWGNNSKATFREALYNNCKSTLAMGRVNVLTDKEVYDKLVRNTCDVGPTCTSYDLKNTGFVSACANQYTETDCVNKDVETGYTSTVWEEDIYGDRWSVRVNDTMKPCIWR
jgi:hypothetical protein